MKEIQTGQNGKERTLVILAGGNSSRMGRDKTFLPYKGMSFLQFLIRQAEPWFSRVCISAGTLEHARKIQQHLGPDSKIPVIADHYDRIGPMGGLLSVFETMHPEQCVLLAVDIPEADMRVLAALSDVAGQLKEAAVMLTLQRGGFIEACAAVYKKEAYSLLKASFERGEYGLLRALGEKEIHYAGIKELQELCPQITGEGLKCAFRNVNTPPDYEKVRAHADRYPEILAPAGTVEAMRAAVNAGCDAVYLGGMLFGARAYAGNFDQQALLETLDFCHLFGVKVYMTVNTLIKESEIKALVPYMEPYYEAGLDGVIVQDVGVIQVLREAFPDLPLHASTQMSISSVYGARLLKEQGLKRIVPARELTLEEISAIRKQVDIEIETFVHGAMCYAYSGKCLFSSFLGGRSGNRGRCAQPCRQCYEMASSAPEYRLSMKDMCTLSILPQLIDAGIHSFKIEGRMKNPWYVAATVDAYKTARDYCLASSEHSSDQFQKEYLALAQDLTARMQDIYNRGGFHTGYYYPDESEGFRGEKGLSMISRERPNHTGCKVGVIAQSREEKVQIHLERDVHPGDVLEIIPAGVELTSSGSGEKGSMLWLKGRNRSRIKTGMEVYRTRNHELLQRIDRDILQQEKKLPAKALVTARIGEPLKIRIFQDASGAPGLPRPADITLEGEIVQCAKGRPVTAAELSGKMKKTGQTHLDLQVECEVEELAFVPMSQFNELRRNAVDQFKESICTGYRRGSRHEKNRDTKGCSE